MKAITIFSYILFVLSGFNAVATTGHEKENQSKAEVFYAGMEIVEEDNNALYFYSHHNQSYNIIVTDSNNKQVLMQTKIASRGTNKFELPQNVDLNKNQYMFTIELSDGSTLIRKSSIKKLDFLATE